MSAELNWSWKNIKDFFVLLFKFLHIPINLTKTLDLFISQNPFFNQSQGIDLQSNFIVIHVRNNTSFRNEN